MVTTTYHRSDNADKYRSNASFVYNDENTREVLTMLDPQPGELILDLGCGSGELSQKIHAVVSAGRHPTTGEIGYVYGLDAASSMIDAAKKGNNAAGLRYAVCDGHNLVAWLEDNSLTGKFDKVFSNAALHWMKKAPQSVAEGMAAALKSSGRLAIEMGGHLNVVGVRSMLHSALAKRGITDSAVDPWYFPTPATYSKLLKQVGLQPNIAYLYPRPTPLPKGSGVIGWLETFAGPFINALSSETEKRALLEEVQEQAEKKDRELADMNGS